MKKILALILLLAHVNFSMFIAQVDETDVYDQQQNQEEDVNSLVQYIAEVFHVHHKPCEDSDDDTARYFHMDGAGFDFFCHDRLPELKKPADVAAEKTRYPPYIQQKIPFADGDIHAPPPKA